MTSPKAKGNARENQVANYLRSKDWLVMVSPRTMRKVGFKYYYMSNDYFNLFDLCAKNKGSWTRWIQVKSHMSDYYKVRKELAEFWDDYCSPDEEVEVWVRTKKLNKIIWRVFKCDFKEWIEVETLNNKFQNL